jgi:uncharacterized membrane protein
LASEPRQEVTILAALGYLPPLFLLPLLGRKDDAFARFHGRQSLVLLASLIVFQLLVLLVDLLFGRVMGSVLVVGPLFRLVAWLLHYPVGLAAGLAYGILVVVGVIQAASGRYWRIPILGAYADRMSVSENLS